MISIIFLSIIQGISEFLPISSSAHLIIFRDLFLIGNDVISSDIELTFDIAVHFGTALAIICFFSREYLSMFIDIFKKENKDRYLLLYIVIATFPAAIVGFLFEDIIDGIVRKNYIVLASSLIMMGIIIYFSDKNSKQEKDIYTIGIKESIIIGLSQVFALVPGFSRSGTTIATSRLLKINREASTKFSFFLSAPIVLGAFLLKILKTDFVVIRANISILLTGIIISFIFGILSIKFLLKYVKKKNFKIFMLYRIILGIIVILYLINA